jgi:hypothetical protein
MVLLLVAKPVDGWCSVDPIKALSILSTFLPKEKKIETPKEDKKEEKKEEPEKKRSGGVVGSASKRADGIAIKGKTRGKMV